MIAIGFFKMGRIFITKFAGRITSKILNVVKVILFALLKTLNEVFKFALGKAADLWPIMCLGLFVYCLVLHRRTVKLTKDISRERSQREPSQKGPVNANAAM